jgi:hypothetical protein
MPEPSFVADIALTLYGFEPKSITSLEQYQFDWRGIYRVQDAQDGVWVMRLFQLPNAVESLTHRAALGLACSTSVPRAIGAGYDRSTARRYDRWMGDLNPFLC